MHHLARSLVPLGARHLLPRSPKRVLVIGGGPTGLYCADRLRHHFEVSLVDFKEYFEWTPGVLRALVSPGHHSRISFDYREVLEKELGVEFICGEVDQLDVSAEGQRGGSVRIQSGDEASSSSSRLSFDYCVVAVGVNNGRWKPQMHAMQKPLRSEHGRRLPRATGPERTVEARQKSLHAWREAISGAKRVVVVGAGLVGVELAGELAYFYPRMKVTLVDALNTVLPQLSHDARAYAQDYLKGQGVKLALGEAFSTDLYGQDGEDAYVIWCIGSQARSSALFDSDTTVLQDNGQIRVNRRMQVQRRVNRDAGKVPEPGAEAEGVDEFEAFGQGKVFAVGDAASVMGVPTRQVIYHGEEMAAVAVANIEAAEEFAKPRVFAETGVASVIEMLPYPCCVSLGPQDGLFCTQSELIATGGLAATMKQLIEETKMRDLQGELPSSLLWHYMH